MWLAATLSELSNVCPVPSNAALGEILPPPNGDIGALGSRKYDQASLKE